MRQGMTFTRSLLATTVASLAMSGTAHALTMKSEKVATDSKGYQFAVVECGKGERVISGGFDGGEDGLFAVVNRPAGRNAWKVRGVLSETATVFAYCSAKLSVTQVRVDGEPEPGSERTGQVAEAKCPAGTSAVAGGWRLKPRGGNDAVFTSAPIGKRVWRVQAANGFPDLVVSAFATCLKGKVETRASTTVDVPGAGNPGTATANCKPSEELLGGGFETQPEPDYFNENGPDTFFSESARDGMRSWTSSAENFSGFAGTIQSFATCFR